MPRRATTLTFTYEAGTGRPDQTKQGSTVLTDHAWAADGTLTSRIDGTFGTSTFGYDWAKRPTTLTPPAGTGFSGGLTHAYRLDGLLARTTYGNTEVATLAYDDARRPIGIDYTGGRWLDRGYDRAGRVVSDDRSLGIAGAAGDGQLTHAYDALGRLLSTRLDGTVIGAYSYDRSSNRLTKTEDTDGDGTLESFAYSLDRTDALISQTIGTGSPLAFTYDPAGNVTTERTRTGSSRTLSWDAANRLTAITPASGNAATLTYDPLDRVASRTITGSAARTFAYVGASDLAWQVPSGSADARLLTGSDGSQPGVSRSGTAKWLLPDLLGSVALAQPATGSISISDALRTDAWGTAIGTYPGTGSDLAIRFRGLVDLSPTADPDTSGTGYDPLYEMGARTYSPHTGSFGSLDTYPGSATNPISMSRYLYAHADPATLIDPTGHAPCPPGGKKCAPGGGIVSITDEATDTTTTYRPGQEPITSGPPGGGTSSNGTTQWAGGSEAPSYVADQYWTDLAWSGSAGGGFAGRAPCLAERLSCTVDTMNMMSPSQRLEWLKAFQRKYGTGGWLDALEGFIAIAIERQLLGRDQFIGQVDANVLTAIQDGMALRRREISHSSVGGAAEFAAFFSAYSDRTSTEASLTTLGIAAEQAAVNAGVAWATAAPTFEDRFLLGGADAWRAIGASGVGDHYGLGAMFTPRSRAAPAVVDHYQDGIFAVGQTLVVLGDAISLTVTRLVGN